MVASSALAARLAVHESRATAAQGPVAPSARGPFSRCQVLHGDDAGPPRGRPARARSAEQRHLLQRPPRPLPPRAAAYAPGADRAAVRRWPGHAAVALPSCIQRTDCDEATARLADRAAGGAIEPFETRAGSVTPQTAQSSSSPVRSLSRISGGSNGGQPGCGGGFPQPVRNTRRLTACTAGPLGDAMAWLARSVTRRVMPAARSCRGRRDSPGSTTMPHAVDGQAGLGDAGREDDLAGARGAQGAAPRAGRLGRANRAACGAPPSPAGSKPLGGALDLAHARQEREHIASHSPRQARVRIAAAIASSMRSFAARPICLRSIG